MDASTGSKGPGSAGSKGPGSAGTWAKAPNFADSPSRVEAVRTQTDEDKTNYLDGEMHPVECRTCGIRVLVRKNSFQHTSIQWTTDPAKSCQTYAEPGPIASRTVRPTCPRLKASIEHAVLEGLLHVRDESCE
jgi:hypothetical protein